MHLKKYDKNQSTQLILFVLAALIVVIIIVLPLTTLFYGSFFTMPPGRGGVFTYENWLAFFNIRWFRDTLTRTIEIAIMTSIIAALIGIPLAVIVARIDVPLSGFIEKLVQLILYTNPLVMAIIWIIIAGPTGFINTLTNLNLTNVYNIKGIAFIMALFYFPYIFLFTTGALRSMDPELEYASNTSGASTLQTMMHITLPLVTPAILSAFLLVFVLALGMYTIPLVIGWGKGLYVVSTRIFSLFTYPPPRYGLATGLSIFTLLITLLFSYLINRVLRKEKKYATVTGRGYRTRLIDVGHLRYSLLIVCFIVLGITSIIPFVISIIISFFTLTVGGKFTLDNYLMFLYGPHSTVFYRSLSNSIFISVVGSTFCMFVAMIISWIQVRTKNPGRGFFEYVSFLSVAVPGIVLGAAYTWTWMPLAKYIAVYNTIWIIIMASSAKFISYGIKSISSSLIQIDTELEECSKICGASWLLTLRRITIPLVMPGFLSGWIFLFVAFFREVSMTALLWHAETITLPILAIQYYTSMGSFPQFLALGLIQTIITFLAIFVFNKTGGRYILHARTT